MRRFHNVPTFEALTFEEDLKWILGRLRGADTKEVIWVDLTRPEFGIPVVRVIVPGLEPAGFGSAFGDYVPGPRARRPTRTLTRASTPASIPLQPAQRNRGSRTVT